MINGIAVVLILFGLTGCSNSRERDSRVDVLPYYNEASFTPQWFEDNESVPNDFHKLPEFSLINQNGEIFNEQSIEGKIVVADFFFTTCPGICPKMTNNMALVQDEFLNDDQVVLLSHSVTPAYDSIPILKEYGEMKGVNGKRWHLLTGNREVIYDLGRNSYFVEEDLGLSKDPNDFIHTENFVLIDKNRHIRGIYNGLNKTSINHLIADIRTLKEEK